MAFFSLRVAELFEVMRASCCILRKPRHVVFVLFLRQCLVVSDKIPLYEILAVRALLTALAVAHTTFHLHGLHKVDAWFLCFQHLAALTHIHVIFFQGRNHSWFRLASVYLVLDLISLLETIIDAFLNLVFVILLYFFILHSVLFVLETEKLCLLFG